MFLSCWAYAQSVEDLNGCIYQINEEEDDQEDDYEVCAARLEYIGEAYSNLDEGVRQDFES